MYKSFFGLKKNPFNVNPDPAYLYLTPQLRQALDELTYGIETRQGLMLLTGEAGTGKTTLINHLLQWLAHRRAHTAFIFNSHLDSAQLFDFILADFEIPLTAQAKANPLLAFNEWLLARYKAHDEVVLIVDEAQGLPVHVLEDIRLLLNMETPNDKLLQIVLAGQPELESKLRRPDLRQLHQRISLRCKTSPLSLQQTAAYIEDRLHTAGLKGGSVFTTEAIEAVHSYSRGIPRVINLLCENALVNAYVEQLRTISSTLIDEAARDLQFDDYKPAGPRLQAIKASVDTPELDCILAKIQADAEQSWQLRSQVSPFLVSAKDAGFSAKVEERPAEQAISVDSVPAMAESRPDLPVARDGGPQVRTWKRRNSRFSVAASLAVVRERYDRLDFASKTEAAVRMLQAAQLQSRTREITDRVRLAAKPILARATGRIEPQAAAWLVKTKIWALRQTERPRRWLSENVGDELYVKSFLAVAAISAALFFFAIRMSSLQNLQHPGRMIAGFTAFLLFAVSLLFGVTILIRARQRLLVDVSQVLGRALRWLRAPMHPIHFREIASMSGKLHIHRRA